MLVQVVDVIEDREGMDRRPVRPVVRLPRLDLVDPLLLDAVQRRPALHLPVLRAAHDRKPRAPARALAGGEDELPDEVVEGRAQVAHHVAEDQAEPLERRLTQRLPAKRVPARLGVVLGVDRVRIRADELLDEVVEVLPVLLGTVELREHTREIGHCGGV